MQKLHKRQSGYVLLLAMIVSITFLYMVSLSFEKEGFKDVKLKQDMLVLQTAKDMTDFSNGVNKIMKGIGAIPNETINVKELKEYNLINNGFNEKTAFNQELKAYYITNKNKKNAIDVLVAVKGDRDEEMASLYGIDDGNRKRFFSDVLKKIKSMGFINEKESQSVKMGIINPSDKTLITDNNETLDISNVSFNSDIQEKTLGIYFEAPNQVGWWRFQVSPYMWQPDPEIAVITRNSEKRLRMVFSGTGASDISNGGFSYFCPQSYTKIPFGKETKIEKTDLSSNDVINICLQTYKGSVNPSLKGIKTAQIMTPVKASDPSPVFDSGLQGRCKVSNMLMDRYPVDDIRYGCVEANNLKTFIPPNNISGLNNNILVNTYQMSLKSPETKSLYDQRLKDRYDLNATNAFFNAGLNRKIDDRYVKMYQMTGTFFTGGDGVKYLDLNQHNFNKISAMGVIVSNKDDNQDSVPVSVNYKDGDGNNRTMTLNLPTPKVN